MSLRSSLKKLIRRDTEHPSLRERAADLRASLSRRTVVTGSIAAAVPLPAIASPVASPSNLANACDTAVAHLAWINDPSQLLSAWPDERLEAELDRVDDVLWRVADEPAIGFDDLSAKARLILANDGQHLGLSDHAGDRATLKLLREVVALTPTRSLPPAPMAVAGVERADYRARLLTAYAEDRASRPVGSRAKYGSVEEEGARLVQTRCWAIAREVMALSPPATADGLAVAAIAAAILSEADFTHDDPTVVAAVGLTRAALAFTGASLPPGFAGFGDEPDHKERDDALYAAAGSLPAWAIAEAQAEDDDA